MVNSPRGSIFVKSMDVSDVCKDAQFLFVILDKMVDDLIQEATILIEDFTGESLKKLEITSRN